MKSAKKYLAEKFESLGKIQEGREGDMDDSAFEHIAEQVKKGYVEGELNHEDDNGKITRGWWKIKIEKDDQDEELRLEEIARIIATGVKHGYNPTFDLNTEWFIEEKRLTPQEIEAQQDEDDEGVEKIERPQGGKLRKGERFEEGAKDAWYLNQYKCSECGEEWENEDDSMMNDRCPKCNAEIEPFKSTPIDDAIEDIEEKKMTQAEIEAQKASEEEDEDEGGVKPIQRPQGSLRKGERFGEGKVYNESFIAKTERWLDQTFLGE